MTVRDAAREYLKHGFVTIPILLDGTKAPAEGAGSWRRFIHEKTTAKDVTKMFAKESAIAIICGHDGLEVFDFDHEESFFLWADLLEDVAPGLLARLPIVHTPDNGRHVYAKSANPAGNQKLANATNEFEKPFSHKKSKTKIETRGVGGYVLAPPSPAIAHEANREYKHVSGPRIEETPIVSLEEREHMLDCAKSLNEVAEASHAPATASRGNTLRPGDDFEARADWESILAPHGWSVIRQRGDVIHWQRPGKEGKGISATTGFCSGQFYCFSSSTQFDTTRKYNKFAVFTILNHGGNFTDATKELRKLGYGALAVAPPEPPEPPMPTYEDLPETTQLITIEEIEKLVDEGDAAFLSEPHFSRILALRFDSQLWFRAMSKLGARRGCKTAFETKLKKHDKELKRSKSHTKAWQDQIIWKEKKDGSVVMDKCVTNLVTVLTNDESWCGVLAMDLFSQQIVTRKPPPFTRTSARWSDHDALETLCWIENNYDIRPSMDMVVSAVLVTASRHAFNPQLDYFETLPMSDGESSIDTWLIDCFGAPDTRYIREIGKMWLVSAVARAYDPGCKVDTVLVLTGKQGLKKSRALGQLCPDPAWFIDGLSELGSKSQAEEIEGKFIVELAELKGVNKDIDQTKAFVSRQAENYRPAYGRYTIRSPRRCVFAGTINTNNIGFLKDETGERRWWIAPCSKESPEISPALRDKLWSEARDLYKSGFKWWIEDPSLSAELEEVQAPHVQLDVWQDKVEEFVSGKHSISTTEILVECLRIDVGKLTNTDQQRVGKILSRLKFSKRRTRTPTGLRWRYYASDQEQPPP